MSVLIVVSRYEGGRTHIHGRRCHPGVAIGLRVSAEFVHE